MIGELILSTILFMLPAYLANMSPVLFSKLFKKKYPIDFGKSLGRERILGEGKTWNGIFIGVLIGSLTGYVISLFWPEMSLTLAVMLSLGALTGDVIKSFFKRRIGIKSGGIMPLADQLDFVLGAFAFAAILKIFNWRYFVIALIITPLLHLITNVIGYKLRLKKVWW